MKKFTLLMILFVCAIGYSQQERSLSEWATNNPAPVQEQKQTNTTQLEATSLNSLGERNAVFLNEIGTQYDFPGINTVTELLNSDNSVISREATRPARITSTMSRSSGGTQTFTTLVDFEAACSGTLAAEDFGNGPGGIAACGVGPMSSAGNGCYAPGELIDDFEIEAFGPGGLETVYVEAGSFPNASDLVGPNTFTDVLFLTFTGADAVNSVSMELFNFQVDDTDVRIYDTGGALVDSYSLNTPAQTDTFFGVITDYTIGHMEIEGVGGTGELLSNLQFGDCSGGGGGGDCSQTDVSNAFENGLGNMNAGIEVADEIIVAADEDFELTQLTVNVINNGGFNDVVVGVYENSADLPGAMLGGLQTIVPTSSTIIGTAFGRDVHEIVLDLTPVMLAGTPGAETVYWISIETPNPVDGASDAFWETTSIANAGIDHPVAFDANDGGWTSQGDPFWNTVYVASGNCSPIGGGSGCATGVYLDRASFDAEAGAIALEDFAGGPGGIQGCDEVISEAGGSCYAAGEILPGIEITMSSPGANVTVYVEAGNFGLTNDAVGSNTFTDYTIINFPNDDVNAFGFDLYGLTAGATMDIRIFGNGGLITTESVTDAGAGGGVFFGYLADETIVSVEIEDLSGAAAELVAQFSFGECTSGGGGTGCNTDMTYVSTATPFEIDGADTSTSDCAAAPNLVPTTVADSGTIGVDSEIGNVTIDITHTWSGDLEISLVSPTGEELILADALSGNTDDAYNGTVFMDGGADIAAATAPFGVGPYAPMGGDFATAFDGVAITGDWMLKVCDSAGGDSGFVELFSLDLCITVAPPVDCDTDVDYDSTATPFEIDGADTSTADCVAAPNLVPTTVADTGSIGVDSMINNTTIDITHTWSGDLEISLVSPTGEELVLAAGLSGNTDDAYNGTVFEDGGADITTATAPFGVGPYAPMGGDFATAFDGVAIDGDWQLKVCDTAGGDSGFVEFFSLNLCITAVVGPDNDLCENATAIDCGDTATGDTTDATSTDNPGTCDTALDTAPGVWYTITVPSDADYQVTIDTFGSAYDTKLGIFSGDCGALVCVAGNDDADGGLQSEVVFTGNADATYYIYVTGFGTNAGAYTLNAACEPIVGTNDNTIEGFSYYPNPATNVINLSSQDNIERVAIYNILGQKVVDQNINATSSQIDVANLVTGTYLMEVSVEGKTATYKVIKN